MPVEITMPQLSDTMTEGTLVKWLKKEGDKVKAGEIVAEVETDKATMEMESFEGGTLAHVVVQEGGKVAVGAAVAILATSKENAADVKKSYAAGKAGTATPAAAPVAQAATSAAVIQKVGGSEKAKSTSGTATLEQASSGEIHDLTDNNHGATRQTLEQAPSDAETNGNGHDAMKVSPLARRIAAAGNIPLHELHGSGPGGRIIQRDVLAYQPREQRGGSSAASPTAPGEKQVIAMTKMRTAIATALQKSKQTIPHFYASIDIDVEDLSKLRERINQKLEKEKVRLSIADFITKAVTYSLGKHPALNARFDSGKNEITRYGDVNLGIAVAVPDGLIVPVLRAVNRMGLKDIRQKSADLIERARAQKLRREEQTEGTFTISSLGTMGIREFNAIINPPEVGILAIGAAEKRAVVKGDAIVARMMLTVTLSADHRVVDGATAAEFLQTLKHAMEEPGMMLI
jgi:pyruvate dehydrogenase E2 component (dihydrolipoamide acetyltransferase)